MGGHVGFVLMFISWFAGDLKGWSSAEFGSISREIKSLREKLVELRGQQGRNGPMRDKVQDWLADLYHQEEIMWRQMARVQWLKEGDRNTCFFQHKATLRKQK